MVDVKFAAFKAGLGVPEAWLGATTVTGKDAGVLYASTDEDDPADKKAAWLSSAMPWRSDSCRVMLRMIDEIVHSTITAHNRPRQGASISRLNHVIGRKLEEADPVPSRFSFDTALLKHHMDIQVPKQVYISDLPASGNTKMTAAEVNCRGCKESKLAL